MPYEEQNQQNLLYFRMNMLQAEIIMQGMLAENEMRKQKGESLAYGEDAFNSLITEYNIHHNQFPFIKY